jgi:hypothetical protein
MTGTQIFCPCFQIKAMFFFLWGGGGGPLPPPPPLTLTSDGEKTIYHWFQTNPNQRHTQHILPGENLEFPIGKLYGRTGGLGES